MIKAFLFRSCYILMQNYCPLPGTKILHLGFRVDLGVILAWNRERDLLNPISSPALENPDVQSFVIVTRHRDPIVNLDSRHFRLKLLQCANKNVKILAFTITNWVESHTCSSFQQLKVKGFMSGFFFFILKRDGKLSF